jgi:2,4-dienoyl-CoA reductase-like NADH-dependent reductase (Old Yellow Enzyme family)/thioredoxin reductase
MWTDRLKRVMSPLKVGELEIKNRVVRTAHGTGFASGEISDQLIAYHLARAEGGVGLSVLESAWVHRSSAIYANAIHNWDDGIIPSYEKLMEAINPTGMRIFQQIWHGGGIYANWRGVQKGPSALPGVWTGVPTRALLKDEIRELADAFVAAAVRCERGGLHGVEIAGSHGYLIMQFLSPWSNQRTDEYGGTLENRARFLREIMEGIRAAVSSRFVLGLRLGPEIIEGGVTREMIIDVIGMLKGAGLIDYVSMSMGGYHHVEATIPALHTAAGVELDWNAGVRAATGVTTFVTGRFRSLDEVEQILAAGEADMVGMTRATIADPHLVRKTIEEGPDAVRPCIGCNQLCVGNVFVGLPLQCTVNVDAGREYEVAQSRKLPVQTASKRVMIVGGGAAGMEAARVAALAGHRVDLHEASPRLGGCLRLVKPIPHLSGLADIAIWLEQEIYRLGVNVHTSSYIEMADILESNPDVVFLATGSMPRDDGWQVGVPAATLANLQPPLFVNVHDLLDGRTSIAAGARVVVADDTGHFEAAGVAEYLLSIGCEVAFVARHAEFSPQMMMAFRSRPTLRRLNRTGRFKLYTQSYIAEVGTPGPLTIGSLVEVAPITIAADHLIMVGFNLPNDSLFDELRASPFKGRVELLGDCASPRYLPAAIHDGANFALSI